MSIWKNMKCILEIAQKLVLKNLSYEIAKVLGYKCAHIEFEVAGTSHSEDITPDVKLIFNNEETNKR